MKKNRLLLSNLIAIFICYYLGHALYFGLVTWWFKMETSLLFFYLGGSLLYNSLIYLGLTIMLDKFVYEHNGEALRRLNLANIISLFRITSLPAVFTLLLKITAYPLLPFFLPYVILVFITDFIDGFIARLLNEVTKIGKYLDSTSDYLILLSVSIIFTYYRLIPGWFFLLIFFRLSLYPAGMIALSVLAKKLMYGISFLGKLSIFLTMFLYAFELAALLDIKLLTTLKPWVEYLTGLIVLVSLLEKLLSLYRELQKLNKARKNERY